MAKLWKNAQDRETGANAIVKLRARQQPQPEKHGGGWQRFRRGGS